MEHRRVRGTSQDLLANERKPSLYLPDELFTLKQRYGQDPHRTVGPRSIAGPCYRLAAPGFDKSHAIDTLTAEQQFREAYPGAIYRVQGKAYRVLRTQRGSACQIEVRKTQKGEGRLTTPPKRKDWIVPNLEAATPLLDDERGIIAECDVQLMSLIDGFFEIQGEKKTEHEYGLGSAYSQYPTGHDVRTTGVLWSLEDSSLNAEFLVEALCDALCVHRGLHRRDLRVERWRAEDRLGKFRTGIGILDGVPLDLHLSRGLVEDLEAICQLAGSRKSARARQDRG